MSNLLQRLFTALIAGSIAVTAIVLSPYGLMLFGFIVSLGGLWEFLNLSVKDSRYRYTTMGAAALVWASLLGMSLLGVDMNTAESHIWHGLILVIPLLGILVLFNEKEKQPLQSLGGMVLGLAYCYLPILAFYFMGFAGETYNFRIPLGILILTWALDVGAYFAGRFLGKRPLFFRISPKKTWAGSIGGAAICLGIAVLMNEYSFAKEGIEFSWIIVGAIIAVVSQLGDLVESMIKRSVAIKDSGSILPGHGGFLDRFDGIYLSIPVLFLYFYFL